MLLLFPGKKTKQNQTKPRNHQRSLLLVWGEWEPQRPTHFLSFALLVFQEKEKKKKKPKTLIPGEVKRKLIFTIKFFYR